MGGQGTTGIASGDAIELTEHNFAKLARDLPGMARRVLAAALHLPRGSLKIVTPEGKAFQIAGKSDGPAAEVILHNWRLPSRAFAGGTIGVAESYFDGDWDSPDVTSFLELFVVNVEAGEKMAGGTSMLLTALQRVRHWFNANTRRGSKKNISAALRPRQQFLRQVARSKHDLFLSHLHGGSQRSGKRATREIPCAGMSIRVSRQRIMFWKSAAAGVVSRSNAAKEIGCRVTGLTISRDQHDYAQQRIAAAGLSDKVTIKLQDYRDETGVYDRIASIEMFEAVGEKYWPVFFSKVKQCLKAGGTAGFQIITINEDAYSTYRKRPDFIQRYVFPGGMLPTARILQSLGADHGLRLARERIFAQDYARTLAEWRDRFLASWEKIVPLGFDDRFRRLWEFYLHYCEAGFRAEYIDVRQVIYRT